MSRSARLVSAPRSWWGRRALRLRVATTTALVTLVGLLSLTLAVPAIVGWLTLTPIENQLRAELAGAASALSAGRAPDSDTATVHVLDTSGQPVAGSQPLSLTRDELNLLKSGVTVTQERPDAVRVLVGRVASAPDGAQRLVILEAPVVGFSSLQTRTTALLVTIAVLGALLAGLTSLGAVGWLLRPVRRLRSAAAELPAGERLPVPGARDELRDLTEALNALLARRDEAVEQLRRFTGDAAHELRSPVTSIRAQADVAVAYPDPELAQETLQAIAGEAVRLSQLVDDLLALARADTIHTQLSAVDGVDLVAAAHAAADRIGETMPDRITLKIEAPAPAAARVTDPEIAVVLDNLLRNAVRYARRQVRVLVLPAARSIRLIVDDDGPGVPVQHREAVFDRFYRVDDSRGRSTGGAGLGLAMVAETVRRRGGTVRVGTSPENGARFEIRLPSAGS